MQSSTTQTSGIYFVRYLAFGLIALVLSIVGLKSTELAGKFTVLFVAGSIFLINIAAVLGYTTAVLKNKALLIEADSPDLAYYLGFCLTVGALSATFITDTLVSQFATMEMNDRVAATFQSDLIKGSLVQFGTGLTATLIGLCAKIFLAARQSAGLLEPEEVYRTFRMELREFTSAMSDATNSYTRSTTDNISEFNRTVTAACKSFEALSKTVLDSNALIASKINAELVTKPISELERAVDKFRLIADQFSSFGSQFTESLATTQKTLSGFDNSIKEASRSGVSLHNELGAISSGAQSTGKALQMVSTASGELGATLSTLSDKGRLSQESLESLNNVLLYLQSRLDNLIGRFDKFADNVSATALPLDRLTQSMIDASASSQEVGRNITPLNTSIKVVNASLDSMKESSSNYTDEMRKLLESFSQIREELNALKTTISGNR